MSTKSRETKDSIASNRGDDVRRNYLYAGRDQSGAAHIYRTIDETVHVITEDGDRERVQALNGRSIHEWMHYVADERGWTEKRIVDSFGEFLAAGTDEGEH